MTMSRVGITRILCPLAPLAVDGFCDALVESIADFQVRLLLEDRAHDVIVPVVVVKVRSWRMAAAGRADLLHLLRFKIHQMINAGPRPEQVNDPRLLFCLG